MRIGNGHPEYTYQMTVDGLPIDLDTTHTEKDLGVYVDDKLKFDFHIHTELCHTHKSHVRLDQAQLHIPGQRESTLSLQVQGNGSSNSGIRSDRLVTLTQR